MARSEVKISAGDLISYAELKRKAKAGDLSDAEIERYFEVDEKARARFRFLMKLKPGAVKITGKRPTSDEVNDLLLQVDKTREKARSSHLSAAAKRTRLPAALQKKMDAAVAEKAVKTRVLAEGDSWFRLPPIIKPRDAMDILDLTHDLVNVAIWSDTLDNMLKEKEYVQKLKAGTFGFFFFSGGGNDVLASIGFYVEPRKPGDTDPANAHKYVNADFGTMIAKAMAKYKRLIEDVKAIPAAANVITFLHGYANAIPVKNGKSIGKALQAKGFDPDQHAPLCRAIVAHMVDLFNRGLMELAAQNSKVVYIDLRPILKGTDWHTDEIHPNGSGAGKIAKEFAQRIAANVPTV